MRKVASLGCALFVPIILATAIVAQDQSSPTNSSVAPAQSPAQTSAPAASPAAEIAHLRVYRQRRYLGSALAPSIIVDGTQVARVGNGRRVIIKLTPGSHTITSDDKSSAISIEAKGGQDYYIRIDETPGAWKGHGKLTMLMPEQGRPEFKMEKPVEPERKFAKEMIEEDTGDADQPGTK